MKRISLTAIKLHELLHYDPETGVFTRKTAGRGRIVGEVAGTINSYGYRVIHVDGRSHKASRLAFLYMNRCWPFDTVDHINMNKSDDRWCNLREATDSQNKANTKPHRDNKIGLKGVTYHDWTGRFKASIGRYGEVIHLGYFRTKEEAHDAYCVAAKKYYGEFSRTC